MQNTRTKNFTHFEEKSREYAKFNQHFVDRNSQNKSLRSETPLTNARSNFAFQFGVDSSKRN